MEMVNGGVMEIANGLKDNVNIKVCKPLLVKPSPSSLL